MKCRKSLCSQSIRQYFNKLIEGIEKGRMFFSSEKDSIILTPAEKIRFSIKTNKKSGKLKLTTQLAWNGSLVENSREYCKAIQIAV